MLVISMFCFHRVTVLSVGLFALAGRKSDRWLWRSHLEAMQERRAMSSQTTFYLTACLSATIITACLRQAVSCLTRKYTDRIMLLWLDFRAIIF